MVTYRACAHPVLCVGGRIREEITYWGRTRTLCTDSSPETSPTCGLAVLCLHSLVYLYFMTHSVSAHVSPFSQPSQYQNVCTNEDMIRFWTCHCLSIICQWVKVVFGSRSPLKCYWQRGTWVESWGVISLISHNLMPDAKQASILTRGKQSERWQLHA